MTATPRIDDELAQAPNVAPTIEADENTHLDWEIELKKATEQTQREIERLGRIVASQFDYATQQVKEKTDKREIERLVRTIASQFDYANQRIKEKADKWEVELLGRSVASQFDHANQRIKEKADKWEFPYLTSEVRRLEERVNKLESNLFRLDMRLIGTTGIAIFLFMLLLMGILTSTHAGHA